MASRKAKPKLQIVVVGGSYIRAQYGYPCFHCGATLENSRKAKCCEKCKGDASHD